MLSVMAARPDVVSPLIPANGRSSIGHFGRSVRPEGPWAFRSHFRRRWQPACRSALIIGAPLAAGFSTGARGLGIAAATAAFAVMLLGAPGYGVAWRTKVLSIAILIGVASAIGSLLSGSAWPVTALLVVLTSVLNVGRRMDQGTATVAFAPLLALLTGVGFSTGWRAAAEHFSAALVGAAFVLLIDRVWPCSEHPTVNLTTVHRGRGPLALLLAAPVYLIMALIGINFPGSIALAALAVAIILTGEGRRRAADLTGLGVVCVIAGVLLLTPIVRADVIPFVVTGVVLWGAARARTGLLPHWCVFGVAVLLASL